MNPLLDVEPPACEPVPNNRVGARMELVENLGLTEHQAEHLLDAIAGTVAETIAEITPLVLAEGATQERTRIIELIREQVDEVEKEAIRLVPERSTTALFKHLVGRANALRELLAALDGQRTPPADHRRQARGGMAR